MTPNDKQARARRPKPLLQRGPLYCASIEVRGPGKDLPFITMREGYHCGDQYFNSKECRQLGEWLIKAANYLDSKKVRRGR